MDRERKTPWCNKQYGFEDWSKSCNPNLRNLLNGLIHIGEKQFGGGRAGEPAAFGLTEQLMDLGFASGRMKTGTPPRLDGRSIHYEKTEIQYGDEEIQGFSFMPSPKPKNNFLAT